MGAGAQRVNELWDAMFVVGTATEDGSDGKGHVEGVPGDVPPCEHGALPGFSSGVASGDRVAIARRRGITVSLGSLLKPSGEQVGDRTIWTADGLTLRLRGKVLEVTGSEALDGILLDGSVAVVRNNDKALADVNMTLWLAALSGVLGVPVPTDFGYCVATTTKVKAG